MGRAQCKAPLGNSCSRTRPQEIILGKARVQSLSLQLWVLLDGGRLRGDEALFYLLRNELENTSQLRAGCCIHHLGTGELLVSWAQSEPGDGVGVFSPLWKTGGAAFPLP